MGLGPAVVPILPVLTSQNNPCRPVPRLTLAKSALAPRLGRNGKTARSLLWGLGGKWSRQLPEESDEGRQECPLSGKIVLPDWMPGSPAGPPRLWLRQE